MQFIALLIIVITVVLIVRRYQTHAILFASGFALLTTAYFAQSEAASHWESLTGLFAFDLFALVSEAFSTRVARIGMIIMAAGGFAKYMSAISASKALVNLSTRPLSHIKNPYVLLAITYVAGQFLNVFIPSAAGLAMLLLVAMYPTLIQLGVRPVAAAAVIGTTACLDLGPASPAANVAAETMGILPIEYFVQYQLKVTAVVVPVIALLHFFWQRRCDRADDSAESGEALELPETPGDDEPVPAIYAILPLLPLLLLFVFSPLMVTSIRVDVVTSMLISLAIAMTFETFRHRGIRKSLNGITHFFKGMGEIFSSVVTLIVAAEIFASGVKATGLIGSLISLVEGYSMAGSMMAVVLVLLLGFTALLTGSGNAALFSFAGMIPGISARMNTTIESLMLPAQFAGGLFRSVSPVAGVIIAVAGAAKVTPFAIIRRTSVPMIGGVLATLVANQLLI